MKKESLIYSKKFGSNLFRKALVVFQFMVSIGLISITLFVTKQNSFMKNFNMGFKKKNMIILPANGNLKNKYTVIKNELLKIKGVSKVSACESSPIGEFGTDTECKTLSFGKEKAFSIYVKSIDKDFFNQFSVEFIAGNNFKSDFNSKNNNFMIINEKMTKVLGYKNPNKVIGKDFFISLNGYKPKVIGVVKDFHYKSLHNEVKPQVFVFVPRWFSEFTLEVNSENFAGSIKQMKKVWAKFFPEYPFQFKFIDDSIDSMYKSETKFGKVTYLFSFIAIFIACLGLLGLTSIITELRKKEIAIRKVLGASTMSILSNISKEFSILVMVATVIVCPITYFIINKWLENFVYRINITLFPFILAAILGLLTATITIVLQSLKASLANPVDYLKYE